MRHLISGSVAPTVAKLLLAAFNGENAAGPPSTYSLGLAGSDDNGATWDTQPSNPRISAGSGWEATWIAQPWLMWDGSQFVIYYTGTDNTNYAIGRATASDFFAGSWTKYGSNPVLSHGAGGSVDEVGCAQPVVHYDPNDSPAWKMWYHGFPAGSSPSSPTGMTVCFADSSDGISWTKRGTVIGLGAGGSFNDAASDVGCVFNDSGTWYVFMAGWHNPGSGLVAKGGWCTTSDPAVAGDYGALTQLTNFTGNITLGGKTWKNNQPRGILPNPQGSGYLAYVSFWNPTVGGGIVEACAQTTSADLTSWATPSGLMLPFETWDSISAENPSVILQP